MKTPLQFWRDNLSYFVLLVSEYYPIMLHNIDKYKNFWVWNKISINPFIIWTPKLLEKYKYDLDWRWYCAHNSMPYIKQDDYQFYQSINWAEQHWSTPKEHIALVIQIYKNNRFQVFEQRYNNRNRLEHWRRPWHEFVFTDFDIEKKVNTKELKRIAENPYGTYDYDNNPYSKTHIPKEFIDKHNKILDWSRLSYSWNLPWNFELIAQYEERWDFQILLDQLTLMEFALKPFITNEFIDDVLKNQDYKSVKFIDAYYQNSLWAYQVM